ncbi:hypothetical protein P3S68_032228 [Capsicum galapagoense]
MCQNNLSGNLPTTFINGSSLRSLNLYRNKLEGKIPRSLANCKELQVLNLGDNYLIVTFPMWLGSLPELQVLSLISNELYGSIQPSIHEYIDPSIEAPSYCGAIYHQDSITVSTKGLEREILTISYLYTVIDLSSNKFRGKIPSIMRDFIALHILNLSHNGLQGHIPPSFRDLSSVSSLDLLGNQLTGEIPQQLVSLTSLSFLNLSLNHLRGCIPQGPQSHTFENNSYEGNDGLHGFLVSKSCDDDRALDLCID